MHLSRAPRVADEHRLALQAAPTGIVMLDGRGRIVVVNTLIEELFGYPQAELLGQPIEMLIPERYQTQHPGLRAALLGDRKTRPIGGAGALHGLRRDGTEVPIEIALNPIRTDAGDFVIGAIVDVSDRKHALDAQRHLAALVESADDAILTKSLDGIVRTWNRGAEHLLGHKAADIIGQSVARLIPEECQDEESTILEQLKEGLRVAPLETRRRRSDGSYVEVSLTVSPIFDTDGTVVGASKIMRDITEQKRSVGRLAERTAALAEANAVLAQKNEEIEAFVYIVSHDLRAPLVNLQGFASELVRSCDALEKIVGGAALPPADAKGIQDILREEIPAALRFISASTNKFERLIDALLLLSRTGRQELNFEPVDVRAIIDGTLLSLRQSIQRANAEVSVDTLPSAVGDVTGIGQVFANLISNALKYVHAGRPAQIRIGGQIENGMAHYWVSDNGAGIAESSQGRLFQVFQRFHPHLASGEGMGLAIVKRVVERHSGRVWAESEQGVGTTFHVHLPICAPSKQD
jgi:PAS domain S-box-containing protein